MKRLTVLIAASLIALASYGAMPVKTTTRSIGAVGQPTDINLMGSAANYHRIYWNPFGTVATCTVSLETSPDETTWTTVIPAQTCTTAGASPYQFGPANFVRFNVTAISGGGAVLLTHEGYNELVAQQKVTYRAATIAKTATAAGTGPFFSICGSATKTVTIKRVVVGGTVATAAVYGDVELRKTSTATSAGTATALTKVSMDSLSPAATANLLNFYTVLATTGANVGMVSSRTAVFPITGTVAVSAAEVVFDWSNRIDEQPPILRGTAQCLEASFGTTTTNAPTLTVVVDFTEE